MPAKARSTPQVSIVMPMYNVETYIETTIRSMLDQTYSEFEYVIVNDCSTDSSLQIAERIASEDSRIRIVSNPKNLGIAGAVNRCFAEAKGDYIIYMDADDISHPERVEKQLAYLMENPDIGMVATQYIKISENGAVLRKAHNNLSDAALRFHLLFGVPVCNPSTAFRKEALEGIGPDYYDASLIAAPDYEFLLKVATKWKMHVLPDYLFYYRTHAGGMSKKKKDILIEEVSSLAIPLIRKDMPELELTDPELADFIRLQGNGRSGITAPELKVYLKALSRLCKAFCQRRPASQQREVKRFVVEMEIKTLLGRYKFYKKPKLLLSWITSPNSSVWIYLAGLFGR